MPPFVHCLSTEAQYPSSSIVRIDPAEEWEKHEYTAYVRSSGCGQLTEVHISRSQSR
jgi:hypothetical protein